MLVGVLFCQMYKHNVVYLWSIFDSLFFDAWYFPAERICINGGPNTHEKNITK